MVTTTGYGTWTNRVDALNTDVAGTVSDAYGTYAPDGADFDAVVDEYRAAINDALPEGVTLSGNEFIGPAHPEDVTWGPELYDKYGDLKIGAIVATVDLQSIIDRHDRT
jgi:hypothetical protein